MFNLRRTPFSSITSHPNLASPLPWHSTNPAAEHTVRDRLDLGGRTDGLVRSQTTLGIDQVRSEDGVDQGRFSQTGLACSQRRTHVSQGPLKPVG